MKKRMFETAYNAVTGKTEVHINFSSLSVMQECQRKADFMFNKGLVSEPSSAMQFGTMVHKAMQAWYLTPQCGRSPKIMANNWNWVYDESGFVPTDDRKTKETGLAAMMKYAETFVDDDLEVINLNGGPAIEMTLEAKVATNAKVDYFLFGTLDLIVKSKSTGQVYVMDHKTTTSLGSQFFQQWKPNHQVSAYILLAQKHGLECSEALIQGIQVVKTKQEVCRVPSRRSEEELQDFVATLVYEADRFMESNKNKFYPGASDYTCGAYAGCQFLDLCTASVGVRNELIKAKQNELKQRELLNANDSTTTPN